MSKERRERSKVGLDECERRQVLVSDLTFFLKAVKESSFIVPCFYIPLGNDSLILLLKLTRTKTCYGPHFSDFYIAYVDKAYVDFLEEC